MFGKHHDVMFPQLNVSPFARDRNVCCGNKMFLKKVQKHFLLLERKKNVPATNVSSASKRGNISEIMFPLLRGPLVCEEKGKLEYPEKTCLRILFD